MDWFLYDMDLRHERVKSNKKNFIAPTALRGTFTNLPNIYDDFFSQK